MEFCFPVGFRDNGNLYFYTVLKKGIFILAFFSTWFFQAVLAQHHEMDFLVGKWLVTGRTIDNKDSVPNFEVKWVVEKGMDTSFCLLGTTYKKGKIFSREMVTYHPLKNEYLRIITWSNGDYVELRSNGWNLTKLSWKGAHYSVKGVFNLRQDIEQTGKNEYTSVFYKLENAGWIEFQKTTGTKEGPVVLKKKTTTIK